MVATATNRSTVPANDVGIQSGTLVQLPPLDPAAASQHILVVTFRSSDGRRRRAVGGGETLVAAIEFARAGCPDDTVWEAETWNELYGN